MVTDIRYTKQEFLESCVRITDPNLKHWFYLQNDGRYKVVELDSEGRDVIHDGDEDYTDVILSESLILASDAAEDFKKFKDRPEYLVGKPEKFFKGGCSKLEKAVAIWVYDKMFIGASLIRARAAGNDDVDSLIDKIYKNLEWLHTTDFFDAPASSIYHESYNGGLLDHTLKVAFNAAEMVSLSKFQCVPMHSAVLIALMHDWCKISNYESYMKNVKDANGKWTQEEAYRRVGEPIPLGHGVLSLFYASRCFRLSVEETAALRWHMGAWRVCKDELNELQSANESYPIVHLIQFADQLSITEY